VEIDPQRRDDDNSESDKEGDKGDEGGCNNIKQ
jgi:hypothetical protein